ncbi:tRNA synthetase Pro [Thermoplasma volcanium GSS1]|uniref:Proline--tRNA ligase n=1 Tax=Thermoplasma volcanium (strain ATCC 51530 / DSM 4299 / JCM 9571 / NBRC 15438 / GSS1) TaxID=273116 RepID=SYP_THEVO|nr:proline--tRNA ligase [Thermoplasma volcanium]Q979Q5.1 RecName: Full=Proline--tRNA ligase; AltName: Full=Prolyl-tRNA synthetase; Short=ProRS [Thermoplasma volcanium GSS1]BAB60247.1 tRNA synthetase Pro [Thermoplasma volcanium GSS1]
MENKKENFSEWYNEIVTISDLSDKRYPIKGMNVWRPYGWKIMKLIDNIIRNAVDKHSFDEVNFPVLISRGMLEVEFEHIRGFENEIYWVTKGGKEKLEEELALRPTSESAMYPMFSLWVRSHADLPLKIYQIVSVYRYETKHTRSFIRIREIHFFEAHTAHESYEDAEKQMDEYRIIWTEIADALCLPFLYDQRPEWDKFPGAMYTIAFDTVMPSGRSLQIGTIHQYGTNFSKNYDIKYLKEDGTFEYVHQTTFGMSERLLAAIIGIHGDDKGLILPPAIAPIQVVIVPIPGEGVERYAKDIETTLNGIGIRCHVDNRDNYTPGYKYNDWEMRGVPLRIEVGERELKEKTVTLAARNIRGKKTVQREKLVYEVPDMLDLVKEKITEDAKKTFNSLVVSASSLDDFKKEGLIKAFWCGSKECSDKIENETEKSALGFNLNNDETGKCIVCGKAGKLAIFSRSY